MRVSRAIALLIVGFAMIFVSLFGVTFSANAEGGKIWICHVDAPPSNNRQAIQISVNAWENPGQGAHSPGAHGGDFGPIDGPNDPSCEKEDPTPPPPPTEKPTNVPPTEIPPTKTSTAEPSPDPTNTLEPGTTPTATVNPTEGPSPSATPTAQNTSEPQPSSTPHPVEEPPTAGGPGNLVFPFIGALGALLVSSGGLGLVFGKPE